MRQYCGLFVFSCHFHYHKPRKAVIEPASQLSRCTSERRDQTLDLHNHIESCTHQNYRPNKLPKTSIANVFRPTNTIMPKNTLYVTGFSRESKAADLAPDFEK